MRKVISSALAPDAIGPYSQAIKVNGMVFTSGQIPLDPNLRVGGDLGNPIVLSEPTSPATIAFGGIADQLAVRRSSLAGKSLNLGVTKK